MGCIQPVGWYAVVNATNIVLAVYGGALHEEALDKAESIAEKHGCYTAVLYSIAAKPTVGARVTWETVRVRRSE